MTCLHLETWNLDQTALARRPKRSAKVTHCPLVVVVAPKGGVGKTTLTMSLLVSAAKSGQRTCGISMDYQKSLDTWAIRRQRQRQAVEGADIIDIPVENMNIHDYRRLLAIVDQDIVIIDTPPGHGEAQNSIMALCAMADLILIPTSFVANGFGRSPSRFAVNSRERRLGLSLMGLTGAPSRITDPKGVLMKAGRLCPVDIPFLEAIPNQFMRGLASTDQGEGGAEWFEALWDFVRQEVRLPVPPKRL